MIELITIKNFQDVSLKLGPMNIFIGANASGKSNFFNAASTQPRRAPQPPPCLAR